jgi:hypothetical protein
MAGRDSLLTRGVNRVFGAFRSSIRKNLYKKALSVGADGTVGVVNTLSFSPVVRAVRTFVT